MESSKRNHIYAHVALTTSMDYASSDDYEYYSSDDDYYSSDEEDETKQHDDINAPEPMNVCNNNYVVPTASTSDVSELLNYLRATKKVNNNSSFELLHKIKQVTETSSTNSNSKNNNYCQQQPPLHASNSHPQMLKISGSSNHQPLHSSISNPHISKATAMATINSTTNSNETYNTGSPSPESLYFSMLKDAGYHTEHSLPLKTASLPENFFFQPTEYHFRSYNKNVISAVQSQNLHQMRQILSAQTMNKDIPLSSSSTSSQHQTNIDVNNRVFDCCNRFGEGILHMACRKGLYNSVEFLLHEAKVTLRCKDDFGRTPMHDAFWSSQPLLEIVQLLVKHDPDLLLISDSRGSSPLAYAPKDQWPVWCEFLQNNRDLIMPRELISVSK